MKFLRHLIPARQLALTLLLLLGCVALYAAVDDTHTQQVVVRLDQAGTLPDKLDDSQKKETASLKVIGNVNGTDIALIREMASWNKGVLTTLDLSEARIVSGGSPYYETHETSQDEIGNYMFYNCTNLVSVELPKDVKAIGNSAFSVCRELASMTIPEGVTVIGGGAFEECNSLSSVDIPNSVTRISRNAFYRCTGLETVNIPGNVTYIGDAAFSLCYSLKSIVIPDGVTSIGSELFSGCESLESVCIPGSVGYIGSRAFFGCQSLTSMDIPESVRSISRNAFYGCSNIKTLRSYRKEHPAAYSDTFENMDTNGCTVYVPQGSCQDYKSAEGWSAFANIVEFDPTGVSHAAATAEAAEMSRYTLGGKRLGTPSRGLNIVKHSDGTVKKVVVK